jgi:acetyl esterase/lipase
MRNPCKKSPYLIMKGIAVLCLALIWGVPVAHAEEGIVGGLDIAYGNHAMQRLDIHRSAEAKNAPVMVYVHGGGWWKGDKADVGKKVTFFVDQGWLFISINYRLLPDGKHPVNVQDVALALAWVGEHVAAHSGNPDQIFLMGYSAGAHLATLVATDERLLKAEGKDLSILKGVISLDTNAYDVPTLMQSVVSGYYGGIFGDDPQVWRDAAPFLHVAGGKGIPPFLICYSRGIGATPSPVRPEQANAFSKKLKTANIAAEVVDASDRNHREINAWFGWAKDDVTRKALAFLEALLKQAARPTNSGNTFQSDNGNTAIRKE